MKPEFNTFVMTKTLTQSRSKIIVVGMNPSTYMAKGNHRKNHTFDRLYRWSSELDLPIFSFSNVFHSPGSVHIKSVDINMVKQLVDGYNKILALGNLVSNVLDKIDAKHFKLPHPSPRNRLLNDKDYERRVLSACKAYLESQ
jgi:hypothetical protein